MLNFHRILTIPFIGLLMLCTALVVSQGVPASPDPDWYQVYTDSTLSQATVVGKDELVITFEGRRLSIAAPVYIEKNRYFIPLTEIISKIDGKIEKSEEKILISAGNHNITIDLAYNMYIENGRNFKLKKSLVKSGNEVYISLFDLSTILNLKTDWNIDTKTVSLYFSREKLEPKTGSVRGRPALIRLEDFVAFTYSKPEILGKMRVISDYLYAENIPFHVAWIPRFIDPSRSPVIDIDLNEQNNMLNADFIYTLDYMVYRNGIIGLHGYSHQYDKSVTMLGTEFANSADKNIPSTNRYANERVTLALNAAHQLDIPIGFFETPHYAITLSQLKIVEKYFDYLYEDYPDPSKLGQVVRQKVGNRTVVYVPTPLNFVAGKKDFEKVVRRMENLKPGSLASFFYHPYLEFEDIKFSKQPDGYPSYSYSDDSLLHKLVREFDLHGFSFVTVYDIT